MIALIYREKGCLFNTMLTHHQAWIFAINPVYMIAVAEWDSGCHPLESCFWCFPWNDAYFLSDFIGNILLSSAAEFPRIYEVSKRVLQEKKHTKTSKGWFLMVFSLDVVLQKRQALLKGLHKGRPFAASQSTTDSQSPPIS